MSEKYSARELAFHYLASQHETLSEEAYLTKLISTEARFTELLAAIDQQTEDARMKVWADLGQRD